MPSGRFEGGAVLRNRSLYVLALSAGLVLFGCVPEGAEDDGDPMGSDASQAGAGGAMQPGNGGAMQPATGGAMQPATGGGMQPGTGGAMPPGIPCDFPAGLGRWIHLPSSGKCLFHSHRGPSMNYPDTLEDCESRGARMAFAAELNWACDEIDLNPNEDPDTLNGMAKVRIGDVYSDGHRLWHDRGTFGNAPEMCGLESLDCGTTGFNGECTEVDLWLPDERLYRYLCIRPDSGVPVPRLESPCDYQVGDGTWTHLPESDVCLFRSNERATYDEALNGCSRLQTELPRSAELDALCDEIVLAPDDMIEGQNRSTKVRVRNSFAGTHGLWHDRGATENTLACGAEPEECGMSPLGGDCQPSRQIVADQSTWHYACLTPTFTRPPPPPPTPGPDAGVGPSLDGGLPPVGDAGVPPPPMDAAPPPVDAAPPPVDAAPPPPEPDMAPEPAPLLDTTLQALGQDLPEITNVTTRRFSFGAQGGAAATFQCQIEALQSEDGAGPWFECESPFTAGPLEHGEYAFRVAAVNRDGAPDRTPAEHTWTIDLVRPSCQPTSTRIMDPMNGQVGCRNGSGFSVRFAREEGTRFQCRRDIHYNSGRSTTEGDWQNCSSPKQYNFTCMGLHRTGITVYLRATDAAGNVCESPPIRGPTWECNRC